MGEVTEYMSGEGVIDGYCNCLPECNATRYAAQVSSSTWPGINYWPDLGAFMEVRYKGENNIYCTSAISWVFDFARSRIMGPKSRS